MSLVLYLLIYTAVLVFVAIGGMFSERSGIINIGLEGIMVIGALGGALTIAYLPHTTPVIFLILLPIIVSAVFGILYSLLLAVAAINFKADQTLVGTAMNILATAAASVMVKAINTNVSKGSNFSPIVEYIGNKKSLTINGVNVFLVVMVILTVILLALSWFLLKKTRFGMRLMACGEHPQAADSAGINVIKMRYFGVMISGVCGGIGGLIYIMSANSQWDFSYGVAGAGFLALAVMIFGQWKPILIALSALLFGFFRAIADVYIGYNFLKELIPGDFYKMLPYIISLVVLALTSKKSKAPKAEGIPYDKGLR